MSIGNGQAGELGCANDSVAQTLHCMHDQQAILCYENHAQDSRNGEPAVCQYGEIAGALTARHDSSPCPDRGMNVIAIAENVIGRQAGNGGNGIGAQEKLAYTLNASGVMGVANNYAVRRLTSRECERLMGFPDDWTRIPWRGKPAEECPDSPRYKACGNSMCVNVMRWIGMRIELVEGGTV